MPPATCPTRGNVPLRARFPDSVPRGSVFRAPRSVGGGATRSSQVPVRRLAKPRCPRTVPDVCSRKRSAVQELLRREL